MDATPRNEHQEDCRASCSCVMKHPACRLVVVTGGPGAGKTALLELVRSHFCHHVAVLPEAAGIIFGGGFPRHIAEAGRRASQRAIFRVQVELERLVIDEGRAAIALCDRGTLDGLAYWPGDAASYWADLGSSKERELARYAAVIHLRTPRPEDYNHDNPLRVESAREAALVDERITAAWSGHPRVHTVAQTPDFLDKVARGLKLIRDEIPPCCRAKEPLAASPRTSTS